MENQFSMLNPIIIEGIWTVGQPFEDIAPFQDVGLIGHGDNFGIFD